MTMTAGRVEALAALVERHGIGRIPDESELKRRWPVPGVIGPGLTCFTGQPFVGKTTAVLAFVRLALEGGYWQDRQTGLASDEAVLIMCESQDDAARAGTALASFADRVLIALSTHWAVDDAPRFGKELRELKVGLVVIDSAYRAVGDVNDQEQSSVFLDAVLSLGIPVAVVHHARKSKSHAEGPAGAQMWMAQYRHIMRVSQDGNEPFAVKLAVHDSNSWPTRETYTIVIDWSTLVITSSERTLRVRATGGSSGTSRQRRTTGEQKATALGRLASRDGLPASLTPNEYATALLGGQRGQEEQAKQATVAGALGVKHITHRTVGNVIRKNSTAFQAGYESGSGVAA